MQLLHERISYFTSVRRTPECAERALQKMREREQKYGVLGLGQTRLNPYFRYPSVLNSPYGSLGVRMNSMIQKPS